MQDCWVEIEPVRPYHRSRLGIHSDLSEVVGIAERREEGPRRTCRLELQLTHDAVIEADPYDMLTWNLYRGDDRKTRAFLHGNGSIVPGGSPEDAAARAASRSAECSRCQVRTSRNARVGRLPSLMVPSDMTINAT